VGPTSTTTAPVPHPMSRTVRPSRRSAARRRCAVLQGAGIEDALCPFWHMGSMKHTRALTTADGVFTTNTSTATPSEHVFGAVAPYRSQTRSYHLQGDPYRYRVGRVLHSYSVGGRREAIQRAKDWGLSPLRRPASRPSTPICSSRSGHSIAYPLPSNCQCCRSVGAPCTRRGYHVSGTTRLRPSARSTVNLSSVTVTCTAMGSVSSTKVVMPCLKESCLVLYHKSRDTANLVCAKAPIGHERHRFQPEHGTRLQEGRAPEEPLPPSQKQPRAPWP
jgi:hypothetical protein